ncbi:prolipoprotein diacylglyceryl transferase [Olavius algarvensis spirochete endosymbiont]|uniref:prolipoprotein diacylglyceryl transferase n=1 Tax=Olavius algarvensis spirochete endosymbiont TaxID=260710 RepID=UPI001E5C7461|nr:prolipoprotein diacylglyceryl transferase [Olavius algarvensis spirochete endosymbiont]
MAFSIGHFEVRYYGLMYIVAFLTVYGLASWRLKREPRFEISSAQLQNIMMALLIGLLIGGRLGYVFLYNFEYYIQHPLEIFLPFQFQNGIRFVGFAGMSYHGGVIGIVLAAIIILRKYRLDFFPVSDFIVPCIPIAYTFGRLGNFINGELYGQTTDMAIGMYFPNAPGAALRHPSQLYEGFFEGIVLFCILWPLRNRLGVEGATLSLYLAGYGIVRFLIEYTREPDSNLGLIILGLSMGQLLSLIMIVAAAVLYVFLLRRERV